MLGFAGWWPGFKSRSGHEFSVRWVNGKYDMRLISLCSVETVTGAASEVTTLRRDTDVHTIVFLPSVSRIPRDLETEKLEIENIRSDT